jgi:hypothetical protein
VSAVGDPHLIVAINLNMFFFLSENSVVQIQRPVMSRIAQHGSVTL